MGLVPPPRLHDEIFLPHPAAYIVSFSLNGPPDAYNDFFQELRECDNWFNYIPGFWIVLTSRLLVNLTVRLRNKIRIGDWLMVMPAKGPADGWLPPPAWDWINQTCRKNGKGTSDYLNTPSKHINPKIPSAERIAAE